MNPDQHAETVPLAALREFIASEAHLCPFCPPECRDTAYVDAHSLELFLRQFDGNVSGS